MRDGIENWEHPWLLPKRFRQANDVELGPELYREISDALHIPGKPVGRYRYQTENPDLVLNHRAKVARLIETLKPDRAE